MAESIRIDRRGMLATGAALTAGALLSGCTGGAQTRPHNPAPGAAGLDAAARPRGLRVGTCLAASPPGADAGSLANPRYAALAMRDCSLAVPENALKWQAIRPSPDRFDFAAFDAILADAESAGLAMRGHTLLWHYDKWFPRWLVDHDFGPRPRAAAERLLSAHIDAVCRRYGRRIHSYDVVNEAVDPDTGGLRSTALSRAMGGAEPVLDLAFHTARGAAPHAELVYNDYMSWEDGNEKHRAGVLRLLEGFRARGTPVDALGVQSHIGIFAPTNSVEALAARLAPEWRRFLDRVTGMGYRLVVTEFDVRDRGLPPALPQRDAAVAAFARAYLDITLSYPGLNDVLCWGLTDRYSWLRSFEPRPDGAITRGLPYDTEFREKPLYTAIRDALAAAPVRPPRAPAT